MKSMQMHFPISLIYQVWHLQKVNLKVCVCVRVHVLSNPSTQRYLRLRCWIHGNGLALGSDVKVGVRHVVLMLKAAYQ